MNQFKTDKNTTQRFIYVRWRGRISGPFPAENILQMLSQNRITKHHEVSEDRLHWRPLAQTDFLQQPSLDNLKTHIQVLKEEDKTEDTLETNHVQKQAGLVHPIKLKSNRDSNDISKGIHLSQQSSNDVSRQLDTNLLANLSPDTVLRTRSVPWIIGFGICPLVISYLYYWLSLPFAYTAWLFSAYFCAFWAWVIGSLIDWQKRDWKQGILYAGFTTFIGITMLLAWQNIPFFERLYAGTLDAAPSAKNTWERLLGFILGVGLLEELCKISPLLLFGLSAKTLRFYSDGLFLGMMSGLGFAMKEGVEYTQRYWSHAAETSAIVIHDCVQQASNSHGAVNQNEYLERVTDALPSLFEQYGEMVVAQLVRFMTLPLLHAAWAGIVGYATARAFLSGQWWLLIAGLFIAATLHGLYNFFSPEVYSIHIAVLSIFLVLGLIIREARLTKAGVA